MRRVLAVAGLLCCLGWAASCTSLGGRCHKGYPTDGSYVFATYYDLELAGHAVDWGTVESQEGRIVITFGLEQGGVYRVVFQAED